MCSNIFGLSCSIWMDVIINKSDVRAIFKFSILNAKREETDSFRLITGVQKQY